jgi:hypothetical protein
VKNSDIKITHKYTLGDTSKQTFCVRYDPNDKYIAAGQVDGSISIYNVFTGKRSYVLNTQMEEPMPITQIRYLIAKFKLTIDGDLHAHQA